MFSRTAHRYAMARCVGAAALFSPSPPLFASRSGPRAGLFSKLKREYDAFELRRDQKLDKAEAEDQAARWRAVFHDDSAEGASGAFGDDGDSAARASAGPKRISENPNACPRSILFVPGSKPCALEKIRTLHADCFILDLEDSVGPSQKREARDHVLKFVNAVTDDIANGEQAHRRLIVRINSPDFDSANALLDLELVGLLGPAIEGVAVPKVTLKTYGFIEEYVHPDHQLWAFFESPQSVIEAAGICSTRKYRYAAMGYNDLAEALQLPVSTTSGDVHHLSNPPSSASSSGASTQTTTNTAAPPSPAAAASSSSSLSSTAAEGAALELVSRLPLWHCSCQVLLAARANQMYTIDGVYNDPTNPIGFRRDLQRCRALGFNGKTLIHPSQVAPTNQAYVPSAEEVAWAMRVKQAVAAAHGSVATVDGKMVEELHVRQATRTVALYYTAQAEESEAVVEKDKTAAAAAATTAASGEGNKS